MAFKSFFVNLQSFVDFTACVCVYMVVGVCGCVGVALGVAVGVYICLRGDKRTHSYTDIRFGLACVLVFECVCVCVCVCL